MKESQAKVLSEAEFKRVVNLVKKKAHAKRNIALLYCSFGLGLRAKEMASLKVKHVLGIDGELLEEINLDSCHIARRLIVADTPLNCNTCCSMLLSSVSL
jgi:integrase/recombinase XerD